MQISRWRFQQDPIVWMALYFPVDENDENGVYYRDTDEYQITAKYCCIRSISNCEQLDVRWGMPWLRLGHVGGNVFLNGEWCAKEKLLR